MPCIVEKVWWKQIPVAIRTVLVSDVSTLKNACLTAQAGDRIIVQPATYTINDWLNVPANVVLLGQTGAKIIGWIRLAANAWAINLEVTYPTAVGGSLIEANAPGTTVINCWLHDAPSGTNALLAGGGSKGGLYYGNYCFNTRHVAYLQNGDRNTPRYFVNNYFGDVIPDPSGNAYDVHAYTEQAQNGYAMHFYENVIVAGKVLLGGQSNATPPEGCEFIGNILFNSEFSGFKRPLETTFTHNKFYRTPWLNEFLWGAGEAKYQPGSTIFQYNDFYNLPTTFAAYIKTSYYTADGNRHDNGVAALRAGDIFDNNRYFGALRNSLQANGTFYAEITKLSDWQTNTGNAGNKFDLNSKVITRAPADGVFEFPNAYDPSRSLVVVANWSGRGVDVDMDLSPIHDPFGTPTPGPFTVTAPEISVWSKH